MKDLQKSKLTLTVEDRSLTTTFYFFNRTEKSPPILVKLGL